MPVRNNDTIFIKELISNINANLHVAQLGRVVFINEDKTRVNVQPLVRNYSGSKRALLMNVPVGKSAQQFIRIGSVVGVIFLDRSMENWDKTNSDFALTSKRMHDLNDALIWEVFT
ncbi:ABC transporter substrate-binding protein [Ligilactobacillus salivarius]|nr:ABC transporter substrate-binding protein [Ligilactobacillus salivarius]MBD5789384.1 ABC transporter substrate-binding protein [Ligilactobacillus salivarius]MBM6786916.1 ABC transporter substrate-binding protein [Ligilactobacillus salivarius]OQR15950.1 ABC transporter substrate-binding protein [Ligilactobacillus salivarius]